MISGLRLGRLVPGLQAWLGLDAQIVSFTFEEIDRSVLIFLGIPRMAGFFIRLIRMRLKRPRWLGQIFLPRIGPWAL
jgi:ACR3 family arsenite transporter